MVFPLRFLVALWMPSTSVFRIGFIRVDVYVLMLLHISAVFSVLYPFPFMWDVVLISFRFEVSAYCVF